MSWNPRDYAANSAAQLAWARELIAKLRLRGDEHLLDVGCGDGKITAELAREVPRGSATGVDASARMIRFAQKAFLATENPNLAFRVMDARRLRLAQKFDVLFSNAALHWVEDHQAFLRGAAACLRPGGRLVVSCGGKGNAHDVFLALRPVIRLKRWREFFRRMPRAYFFYAPEAYNKWLPRFGFRVLSVRLTPKVAAHEGRDGFTAWFRTTWMPYTQRVPEALREDFINSVAERHVARHPPEESGKIWVRMVRLEIDAVRV